MGFYALRRLLVLVPVLFGISALAFSLSHLNGDPAEAYAQQVHNNPRPTGAEIIAARRELGLDRPIVAQYLRWSGDAVRGRFGTSYATRLPVSTEFAHRLPRTLELVLPAIALSLLLGIPTGIVSASHRGAAIDHVLRFACLAGGSMPGFWLAILLIDLFAVRLRVLPIIASQGTAAIILPVLTLALPMAAGLARFTRSAMLETMGDDYVRTATAKGLAHQAIMERHVLPNALIPLVTVFGGTLARLASGAAIIETVFSWPGLGALAVNATRGSDFPVIQAFVVYTGTLFVVVNLLVDLAYTTIDPRIRLAGPATA